MDIPILMAGQTREIVADQIRYTLRALTYAEVSALQVAALGRPRPSEAVVNDALRQACEAAGRFELSEAVTRHETAQDAMNALFFTRPSAADPTGQEEWMRVHEAELVAAQRDLLAAERGRTVAVDLAAEDARVLRLRQQMLDFLRGDALQTVAAGLLAMDGAPCRLAAEEVAALPAAHVELLARTLREMMTPAESAAKN